MKRLNLVLLLVLCCSLFASNAYSQGTYCSLGGGNTGACFASGTDQYSSNEYIITCPTGNFRYDLESTAYAGSTMAEADLWGDIISVYATANYPSNPNASQQGNVPNLNPNTSYTVDMFAWTMGDGYASVSVSGW